MTGTNWFGFNTGTNMFDGIWQVDLNQSLNQIAMRGFNVLRIPLSTQILDSWRNNQYPSANINSYLNSYLQGKTSLEMLDYVIQYLKSLGMKAILDMHSIESVGNGHMKPLWYENSYTSETFFSTWEWIVDRYRGDDTVIGIDLKNEPHGVPWTGDPFAKWDASNDESNWKKAAETAAMRILARNPNLLVLVEGVENYPLDGVTWTSTNPADYSYAWWGGNLRGVAKLPITIGSYQSQVVYTPHEYGPSVFVQTWFYEGFNKNTLYADCWYPSWFYIVTEGIAPIYIGEWGGKLDGGDNEKWMTAFRDFIMEKNLNHTYWCYNANSNDTQGLVTADWTTWDETKYAFVKPTLWQNPQGKFVGLDHAKPLYSASTGTTVTEFYAQGNPEPSTDPMPQITPTPNFALGDVNHSGAVDIVDALLIAQFYVGKILDNFDLSLADVNQDGSVNIVDALLIAQLYIGKIAHF
jgi:endoglucanase